MDLNGKTVEEYLVNDRAHQCPTLGGTMVLCHCYKKAGKSEFLSFD